MHLDLPSTGVPIKAWTRGVELADNALEQLRRTARSPAIRGHLAVMPDCHWGMGATIGSVIPTEDAIIPAAVGVDIGCGMVAVRTSLVASDLPTSLHGMRERIEQAVPHGRTGGGRRRKGRDKGAWGEIPERVAELWATHLAQGFAALVERYPELRRTNNVGHLGTLGTGNHFVEVCLDEAQAVWLMLHSGSRGVGNRIATVFIEKAKDDMRAAGVTQEDEDLSYLTEGTAHFDDYVEAVTWAQDFARLNRRIMMESVIAAVGRVRGLPRFRADVLAVDCHHNYVTRERHFDRDLWITRKGAVRAGHGELGIIPGSMGARSYVVRGLGSADSYHSCSHGAGRVLSRTAAKKRFTVAEHAAATEGVECRKDDAVLDETPMAYKDIDAVMAAQADLVEVVHTLKQVVCVKG